MEDSLNGPSSTKPLHVPISHGKLPLNWSWSRLDAICEGIFDCPHSTPKLTTTGPFVVRTQDIITGVFRSEQAGRVSEETYIERTSRVTPSHGDLLYSREGTYFGIAAEVPDNTRVCLGQRMVLIRPHTHKLNFGYLCYWLNSPVMAAYIKGFRDGSVAERLNLPTIRALPVLVPPLPEQKAIAHILGTLDDKIELNRRMNATLEAMARALFQSWFVDATQTTIPKGWREGVVAEIANLSREGINPGDFPAEVFDHYSIPAFDEGRTPSPDSGELIKSNKFIVPPGCVLVSKLNPRIPRIWLPDLRGDNRAICSTEFLVITPKTGVSREFLFCLFSNEVFISSLSTMVTGTSNSHQRVRPESLLSMPVVIPPAAVMDNFTKTTQPLLARVNHNINESRTLAGLRDTLLPKLLSGDLRVQKNNGNQS